MVDRRKRTFTSEREVSSMMRRNRRKIALAATATALATGTLMSTGSTPAQADDSPSITPVLSGLAAPRGITFDRFGSMYVAESGTAGSGPAGMTQTGKVDKYRWGRTTPAWSTSFSSLYATEDPSAPPDVLGPEGLSSLGKGCLTHHHARPRGCQVRMIMSESTPGVDAMSNGAIDDPQAGHLFRLRATNGAPTDLADVGTQMWNWTDDHSDLFPDDFPDSNPYGVLVTKDRATGRVRTFVADAGANTIVEVNNDGDARVVAYIPNETAAPFRDSTPTCIAQGPDGYLYVGTLDLLANFAAPDGNQSNVWRVDPNADYPTAPKLWASGLTTVTACTFDRSGNFWATEMFQGGPGASAPGDVVKIPFSHPGKHTRIGLGQLPLPGGIAQGPDRAMYVTVGSAAPGTAGGVMRIGHH
jgi:hypothetical protein